MTSWTWSIDGGLNIQTWNLKVFLSIIIDKNYDSVIIYQFESDPSQIRYFLFSFSPNSDPIFLDLRIRLFFCWVSDPDQLQDRQLCFQGSMVDLYKCRSGKFRICFRLEPGIFDKLNPDLVFFYQSSHFFSFKDINTSKIFKYVTYYVCSKVKLNEKIFHNSIRHLKVGYGSLRFKSLTWIQIRNSEKIEWIFIIFYKNIATLFGCIVYLVRPICGPRSTGSRTTISPGTSSSSSCATCPYRWTSCQDM